jgi:hypothetical protein
MNRLIASSNMSLNDSSWRKTGGRTLRERKYLIVVYKFFPCGRSFDATV